MPAVRNSARLLLLVALFACGGAPPRLAAHPGAVQRGLATWYGPRFQGRRTASGERYQQDEMTAAHRSLPFGTRVRVTNLKNGRAVTVRINDRGPFGRNRIIDVSRAAARALRMIADGIVPVTVEVLALPRRGPES